MSPISFKSIMPSRKRPQIPLISGTKTENILHMLPKSLQWTYNDSFIVVQKKYLKEQQTIISYSE